MELKSFPILPVKVYSNCDSLTVNGKETKQTVFNDFEKVRKCYGTKNNSELTEDKKEALKKELRFFHKHLDKRSHCFFYRKCSAYKQEKVCKPCKANPIRLSNLVLDDLPSRNDGGLFYSNKPDETNPGHYMTFLQHCAQKSKVVPDEDIPGVERCQFKGKVVHPIFRNVLEWK